MTTTPNQDATPATTTDVKAGATVVWNSDHTDYGVRLTDWDCVIKWWGTNGFGVSCHHHGRETNSVRAY